MNRILVASCIVLLTSCSSAPGAAPSLPDGTRARVSGLARESRFTRLFSFDGADGQEPRADLIVAVGALFGTTYGGGARHSGTAFEIETSGMQNVLHSFRGGADGALPDAPLVGVAGTFYGTTVDGGGSGGEGTVFAISPSGQERVVYRFKAGNDGASPYAGLVAVGATLYGTTAGGGKHSEGTVYEIDTSGRETVLHSFGARVGDGATPLSGLANVGGTLYGTTEFGGAYCGSVGCGCVFKIAISGAEKILYSFGGKDGSRPATALVSVKGMLYGTTAAGGQKNRGTVFGVTTSGKETVLHSFQGGQDGAFPRGLTAANGILYGTTSAGGSNGAGTVFELTTTGRETTLHAFKGADGARPQAGLLHLGGALYGTTALGGANNRGTVFRITP
jgi:uncharacterized repeat protein (TIGR03803 family)